MYKILHIISDKNIGGAGILLLTLLKYIDPSKFDVTIVLPKNSLLLSHIKKLNIKNIEIAGLADTSFSFKATLGLKKVFLDIRPDIVHTHAALSAKIAAKLYSSNFNKKTQPLKIVSTRHVVLDSQNIKHTPKYKKSAAYKLLNSFLNNLLSHKIIATSPAAKFYLLETGIKQNRISMIYNGVDAIKPLSEIEKQTYRHKYNIEQDDFVCSIVARLEAVKGHDCILKAAQLVQTQDKAIKFIIAGTGSKEDELKEMAKKLNLQNCIFAGFVNSVREIHGITDLQINASFTETSNQALLEGMSLGIPAAATDTGGNPYVINDGVNGVLFPVKDYAALYKAIINLKENQKLYSQLSRRSSEIYNEKFTSKAMVKNIENVYLSLLNVKKV